MLPPPWRRLDLCPIIRSFIAFPLSLSPPAWPRQGTTSTPVSTAKSSPVSPSSEEEEEPWKNLAMQNLPEPRLTTWGSLRSLHSFGVSSSSQVDELAALPVAVLRLRLGKPLHDEKV